MFLNSVLEKAELICCLENVDLSMVEMHLVVVDRALSLLLRELTAYVSMQDNWEILLLMQMIWNIWIRCQMFLQTSFLQWSSSYQYYPLLLQQVQKIAVLFKGVLPNLSQGSSWFKIFADKNCNHDGCLEIDHLEEGKGLWFTRRVDLVIYLLYSWTV